MKKLITKSIKIVETEIYNNRTISFFVQICILLLVLLLQFGDITQKVTGNYIILVWVAMNVCLTFHIFLKNDREHILCIGKFKNWKRCFFLTSLVLIMNLLWFFATFIQLVGSFHASFINAILLALVQYLYAIAFGAFGGVIRIKGLGILFIGAFGIFNFVFCNPYNYEASSHMFLISELTFTVNDINIEGLINTILFMLFFFTLAFWGIKIRVKRTKRTILFSSLFFIIIYAGFLEGTFYSYQKTSAQENIIYYQNTKIEYKGFSEKQIENLSDILLAFKEAYHNVTGDFTKVDTYCIQKKYLPQIVWLIRQENVSPIQVTDDKIEVNILSRNMLYFENADLLKSFLEELSVAMEMNVSSYGHSKFTRHVINGYTIGILEKVSSDLELASAKKVYDYYCEDNQAMLALPATKYNYIKRIAYIVYSQYPELVYELYESVCNNNINSDEEFIDLLKTDFTKLYYDTRIAHILKNI
ncbi:hypothetical protein IMSAGC011_01211 [Lachnospiraceae bacterium]|nr:hypothetical protein IMSAGC011_01211 [Lachnospiraceae bacterium]